MNSKIIKTLEESYIKPTPMRMLVLEQLILQQRNLSLSDMEELLYPSDRITIYRTLRTFEKHGLVHSVEAANGASVYALCSDNCEKDLHQDHHPHFFCETCNKIICAHDFTFSIETKPGSPKYQINKIEVSLKGVCPDCMK